jgi:hypothetical protein
MRRGVGACTLRGSSKCKFWTGCAGALLTHGSAKLQLRCSRSRVIMHFLHHMRRRGKRRGRAISERPSSRRLYAWRSRGLSSAGRSCEPSSRRLAIVRAAAGGRGVRASPGPDGARNERGRASFRAAAQQFVEGNLFLARIAACPRSGKAVKTARIHAWNAQLPERAVLL